MKAIEDAVKKLEAIAKKNNDEFEYTLMVVPDRDGIIYEFEAAELADGHCFCSGCGATIEASIRDAMDGLADACKKWDYKF